MAVVLAWLAAGCAPVAEECPPPAPVSWPIPPDPNPRATEVFLQATTPRVDALWVVGPMDDASDTSLAHNAPFFFNYLVGSGIDYHLGVVTTDMSGKDSGVLEPWDGQRYLHPNSPPASFVDVASIVPPEGASAGFDAMFAALDTWATTDNAGFRREDAPLHTLVLSDEDDSSSTDPKAFVAWYQSLGGVTSPPPTLSAIVPADAVRYRTAYAALGGDIAEPAVDTWRAALDQFGVLSSGLQREFFLSGRPTPDTLRVEVAFPIEGEPDTFNTVTFEPAVYDSTGELANADPQLTFRYDEARNSVQFVAFVPEARALTLASYRPIQPLDPFVPERDCPR